MNDSDPMLKMDTFIRDEKIIHELRNRAEKIGRWTLDTRNAQTRVALIKMGWTPPPEQKPNEFPRHD